MPANAKVVGGAALWSMGNAALGQGLSLLSFLITARIISPEAFGIVAVATTIIEVLKRVLIEPFALRLLSSNAPEDRDFQECFSNILTLSLVGAILLLVLAEPLGWLTNLPELPPVLMIMAVLMLGIGIPRTHEVWHARRFEFRLLSIRTAVATGLGAVAGVSLAVLGFGIWSLVAQQIVLTAASFTLLFLFSSWRPRFRLQLREATRTLISLRYLVYPNVTAMVGGHADLFFVVALLGAAAGGIYNAAKRLLLAAGLVLIDAVQSVILASFAERSHSPRAYQMHLDSLEIFLVLTTPLFVGLAILSDEVIHLLLGAKWQASSEILAVLSFGALGGGATAVIATHLMTAGADRSRTAVIVGTAVATIAIFPIVAPYGAAAIAIASVSLTWMSVVAFGAVAAFLAGVSLFKPFGALLLPLAGGGAMLMTAYWVEVGGTHIWRLLIMPPLLLLAYLLAILLLTFTVQPRLVELIRKMLRHRG